MRRHARVINFAIRPDCRPNWRRQMLLFQTRRNQLHVVVTDGRVRDSGVLVRTRNSGENEAIFFIAKFNEKTIC
jgi:hypothetical protein